MIKPFIILVYAAILAACTSKMPADLIIRGGTIYTVEDSNPVVEAVAVVGNKIVYAGDLKNSSKYEGENTQIIDLQGKTMTPGFIEGHGHLLEIGYNELNLDLMDAQSFDQIIERVKVAVQHAEPGQWIEGRGWHQDKWIIKPENMVKGFPIHDELSKVSPNNPVVLRHANAHLLIANERAMSLAGVNQLSKEKIQSTSVEDGEIFTDPLGNPTGIFNENAMNIIRKNIPPPDHYRDSLAIELAIKKCNENGITSFHDAGLNKDEAGRHSDLISLLKEFKSKGKLTLRIYEMLSGWNLDLLNEWYSRGVEIDTIDYLLTIRAIKLNCDGALGSRGAWLLESYTDQQNEYGRPNLPMDFVLETSRKSLKAGFQVCSHAIGDRTNREILNRYEIAFKENPEIKDHRFRIEHAQHIHPLDIPRFGQLGVIPAMQGVHMSSDRPWAIDRLGEKRIKEGAYMWQSLLKSGAKIVNGTDAPVEPVNPIASFFASVTRQTLQGQPEGGYESAEKMTRQQALKSYTIDAAYGAFEENIKGSIASGKLADFTIFSKDIMTVSNDQILSTEVSMTILGGKVLYENK